MRIGPKGSHRDSHRCSIYVCMHTLVIPHPSRSFLSRPSPEPDHPFVPTNRTFHELICSFGRGEVRSFHADDVPERDIVSQRGKNTLSSRFTGSFHSLFRHRVPTTFDFEPHSGILTHRDVCTRCSIDQRFGLSLSRRRVQLVASEY